MKSNFREFALKTIDDLGLSDYEVAQLTGIKSSSISRWRTGKTIPRRTSLRLLAELVGSRIRFYDENDHHIVEWVSSTSSLSIPQLGTLSKTAQHTTYPLRVYTWSQALADDFFKSGTSPQSEPVHELPGIPEINDPLAYALIVDQKNNPLIDPYTRYGDVMVLSPAATVKNGDHVIAKLANGRLLSRKILFQGDDIFFTGHENEHADFSIESHAVNFYHKIIYIRKR